MTDRTRIILIVCLVLVMVGLFCVLAHCQTPPAQPQVYAVIEPARFPWVRYRVLGWGPRVELYQAVGQPWTAQVQPVTPWYPRAWPGGQM